MIHEAMVLEYSGRSLALIELAAHIKQLVFFSIIASLMLPCGAGAGLYGAGGYLAKLLVISLIIALTEISLAKMRLFHAVDFLGFALVLALAGALTAWSFFQAEHRPKAAWVFLALLGLANLAAMQGADIGARMVYLEGAAVKPVVSVILGGEGEKAAKTGHVPAAGHEGHKHSH